MFIHVMHIQPYRHVYSRCAPASRPISEMFSSPMRHMAFSRVIVSVKEVDVWEAHILHHPLAVLDLKGGVGGED